LSKQRCSTKKMSIAARRRGKSRSRSSIVEPVGEGGGPVNAQATKYTKKGERKEIHAEMKELVRRGPE